jgi:DNA-binding transcriptional regulator YiaG
MDDRSFEELKRSLKEAAAISRGERKASRRVVLNGKAQMEQARFDVKNLRERLDLSQSEFAGLLRVSVRTLQNWEQGSRRPTGPAEVLLELVSKSPQIVIESLHLWGREW